MASLLEDLQAYLKAQGYANVYRLQYPPEPDDVISLYEREAPLAFGWRGVNYGIRAAPVQIRVRRLSPDAAEVDARTLFELLDSGPDERMITLAEGRNVTSRPLPPFPLEQDERLRWVWVVKTTIITYGL